LRRPDSAGLAGAFLRLSNSFANLSHHAEDFQSHDFVVPTPRTIITTIMMATSKRAHRPHCCHGMPSHMVQKVAKQAGYVASIVGAFATAKKSPWQAEAHGSASCSMAALFSRQ
jgi:hypothetical protein